MGAEADGRDRPVSIYECRPAIEAWYGRSISRVGLHRLFREGVLLPSGERVRPDSRVVSHARITTPRAVGEFLAALRAAGYRPRKAAV